MENIRKIDKDCVSLLLCICVWIANHVYASLIIIIISPNEICMHQYAWRMTFTKYENIPQIYFKSGLRGGSNLWALNI